MEKFLRHEKEVDQELILETDCDEIISSDGDGGQDEDSATAAYDNNVNGSEIHIW